MTETRVAAGDAWWMPFTPERRFAARPRLLARAEGMYYYTPEGRPVLDATAGLWCVNAGHNVPRIVAAVREAAGELDFAPSFNLAHPAARRLATRLAALLPGDLDHVFFVNSGSEAVDTALKMARAYHRARGEPERVRFVGRARAYHGVNFGGLSVGGIPGNRAAFGPLLSEVDHLPDTHDPARNAFSRDQPTHGAERADALEALIARHGAGTIAAVIVEPVAGSTGVLVPPVGYLERLRAICDAHGILLIFDEVITGFGRTGAGFACERFGVLPDIVTLAKGMTNAAVPMGAAVARAHVRAAIVAGADAMIEFAHGYTYSGHPLACAAGLAALETFAAEELFARAAERAPLWREAMHSLADAPHVVDVRQIGLMAGIELAPRPGAPGERGQAVFAAAFESGLLIRVTGDTIALSPPLIVTPAQVDEIVDRLRALLAKLD